MHPSNPFGSPQGGAFQAPSNAVKSGLFQSFGPQGSSNQPQTMGFYQPSAFGQPHQGNTVFGQNPSFGQSSTQPSSLPTVSQAPVFGQTPMRTSSSGFSSSATPAFGQTSQQTQSSVFTQIPAFGQPSLFGKQSSGFGSQPSGFGNSQSASSSSATLRQPQPLGFGQSVFGQPPSTSVTSSVFGTGQSVTQSKGFGSSNFSFKPANEALFKPIFSASPEPTNTQTTSMSSSSFGNSKSQTNTTTTGFSLLTAAKSGPLGFSFAQPAAAPSVPPQNNSVTTGNSSGCSNSLQFTFSQPAAPSNSSTQASTCQPTTPTSFSFAAKAPQSQATPLFGGTTFGQQSPFGETKAKAQSSADEKGMSIEAPENTNVFSRLSKGTKRKEDTVVTSTGLENPATEEDGTGETGSPRHPSKRPLVRSRRPGLGLFGRALIDLRKDNTNSGRQGSTKEPQQQESTREETEREDVNAQSEALTATPPSSSQTQTREVLENIDQSEAPDPKLESPTSTKLGLRRESSESLSGMSPNDCTILQCRNVLPALNRKDVIEKHFSRFGKVRKVFCRPGKNLAIVYFDDHASAAKAKKKGKMLHSHELLLLWQRKKHIPGTSEGGSVTGREETVGESQESKAASSSLKRASHRPPAASSMVTFSHSSPSKKIPLAKSLQFDAEAQRESNTDVPSSETLAPSSLLHLIGHVAETPEDKYRLLEQKDKILRQGRPKRTGLDMSRVFVGTCPDMCPEKERYMRETRNQLSVFEVIPDTEMVDHKTAIKEYSRSSADQEEPLPHELRPLPVLSMTMDYLVTQIMDQFHDNSRDWYDFVWNRTRSIRKDITQQRLCCPLTVSLIEKCTRFHVHCAHHLCQERILFFDAKINNENMTKCLQSLKEMYQDLATRHIYCPREAEFRQYSVLLKLNDGDILREVQQFRDEVRNSPEVKFAVQAFAAVNNNNFVRFFKLVKGASYLASCLLHRYFNQVRAKALKTLNLAHTVGPRSTAFPVEDIVRMLMFRNNTEASDFIQQYGLVVNDDLVELSRINYQEPDLPLTRKSDVILAKIHVLIGEVVNGGQLPNPPQHIPVCSFDSKNKYCGEGPLFEPTTIQTKDIAAKEELKAPLSIDLETQVKLTRAPDVAPVFGLPPAAPDETGEPTWARAADDPQLFQPISQPLLVKPPSPRPKPQPFYSDEDITAVVDSVIEEVVDATVREVAQSGASYATAAVAECSMQAESLLSEVVGQMLQEVSSAEIKLEQECVAEKKRKLEEARRREEHNAFLVQSVFSFCTEILNEVLDETIEETATSEIQQAVNEKAELVAKCTEQICSSLVEETLNADITSLVEDILENELHRIHKYIRRWRDVVKVRRQLKRQMRSFPASPCCVDPRFKLKALTPSAPAQPSMEDLTHGQVNLGNAGTLALSSTRLLKIRDDVIHQMRVDYFYQHLVDEVVWTPLNLPALVTEGISDPADRIFWKAVLLLPSVLDTVTSMEDRILSDWLEVKLSGGKPLESNEEELGDTLRTLCTISTLQEREQHLHKVHISIKVSKGPLSEDGLSKMEECCELQGAGALIMLLPSIPIIKPGHGEQDIPFLSALLQLKQLQKASSWQFPLPLVILVPGSNGGDAQELAEMLMLHTLVKESLISEFTFVFIPETTSDLQGTKKLIDAMHWLLARVPPRHPLSCQTLAQLVETSLSHEFSPRVYSHRQERAAAANFPSDPTPFIQLYNAILAHVADRVTSKELSRLSWPPVEFYQPDTCDFVPHLKWNSVQHLDWIRKAILCLQLPQWNKHSYTDSWSELCSSIFHYATQIPASRLSQPLLMSRLENLLERVRPKGHRNRISTSKLTSSNPDAGDWNTGPASGHIPWDDIVDICIDHKLKDWQIPEPPVCEVEGEILVYFSVDSLKGFQPPEEWTEAIRRTHREKQKEREGVTMTSCATPAPLSVRQRLFNSMVEPPEAPTALLDITHSPTAQELLVNKVIQSLEEEKAENKRFFEQFQCWVDGEPVEHLSTALFIPSSTLLSMPTTITHPHTAGPRDAAGTQELDSDDPSDKANWLKTRPVSIARQARELEQQIWASREEEMACALKLSNLLSIVND
ncbi:germinal-center associated nuclear protein isoform X2 [Antennarius striatus]|uniref:germinal-center associated nuclear protein isoform X2 n=1 Tax=Antennarius striatus TaxID=241820 RepID=UPI0035AFD17F